MADAAGVLTEQGAAMLVTDFLRQQQMAGGDSSLSAELYNFQIIRIHRVAGGIQRPPQDNCLTTPSVRE